MVHVKKMVMTGFKSFARRTEIPFDKGVNVVLGPNGSGKSNVADALCFVLGRLSIKSMRAAKAKNLLFMGSKFIKPAKEASVEIIFDNSDKAFAIDKSEVNLTRIVRHNGISIYKINGEVKTRTEAIEMLAQAGIDPYGFNIILQGQIQHIVRMHSEDRRKIIEEVAGISIYESKKEKSLHEMEKTDEKLKEISAILRERTIYLKNLEKERIQALKFKDLEKMQKRLKASILSKKIEEKSKELEKIKKSIQEKTEQKDKERKEADLAIQQIESLQDQINQINKKIQQATGVEQESLHNQVSNLKAELEGLKVRKENFENKKFEVDRRIEEMKNSIPSIEEEIKELRKESPLLAKKSSELKKKKDELSKIEEERSKLFNYRTELYSLKEILKDRERQLSGLNSNSEIVLKQIDEISQRTASKSEEDCIKKLNSLKSSLLEDEKRISHIFKEELKNEKDISVAESEISRAEEIKLKVGKIDICPLCQSKITHDHVTHVFTDSNSKISEFKEKLDLAQKEISEISTEKNLLQQKIKEQKAHISELDLDLGRHKNLNDKKEQLKSILSDEKRIKDEIISIENKRKNLEIKIIDLPKMQEKYDSIILEIEEISSRTKEDTSTSLLYKERDLENTKNIIKHSTRDLEEVNSEIKNIEQNIKNKLSILSQKEKQEEELNVRFKKMFESRDEMQISIQEKNVNLSEVQSNARQIEDQINYLKIGKAKIDAEKESIEIEMRDFAGHEIIRASFEILEDKLKKTSESLILIGSINMRALEVYDEIKKEYDSIQEKVNILEKEKADIMKIIEEIDKKKIRSFMKTFKAMNSLFTENFSKLYNKGIAYLEIENQEDVFAGGVNIVVKLAKGKYFDVTSLSGGEQTLVALSLLFAIQEYRPYPFYIFDEIDAALDKRNSERLAALLNQYLKSGQYIVITHNDSIIMSSNVLYGVSMHEGVSKILSLKVDNEPNKEKEKKAEN